ncbi:hypothetical protein BDW69DRAFT_178845 [Aspergillus filifer]
METGFYSSLNWALTTDPTDSLFPALWEAPSQAHRSEETWPVEDAQPQLDLDLDLLLSASSYPIPEFQDSQFKGQSSLEHSSIDSDSYGGLVRYDGVPGGNSDASALSASTAKNRASKPAEPARKRGRPRILIKDASVNPEERRRTQVRMAQRAYRSRKEANVSQLKERINQLETAVKQMSTSVISFGDDLVRSGALDSHPELLKPLGNTVQACLALPVLPYSDTDYQMHDLSGSNLRQRNKLLTSTSTSTSSSSSTSSPPPETMPIPEFIDRLHITCSYQAYLITANPSIPQKRLERPFRILLSLMPRSFVASYFKDWLLAKAGHKTLDHWDHIPLFRVGGAGTHYATQGNVYHPFPTMRSGPLVEEDVTRFVDFAVEDVEDLWFDLGDLQGYLLERGVVFPAYVPAVGDLESVQKDRGASGVARLMQRLVRSAICLGRSPGFRRRDVEAAINEFLAAQDVRLSSGTHRDA